MILKSIALAGMLAATTALPLPAATNTHTTTGSESLSPAKQGAALLTAIEKDVYEIRTHAETLESLTLKNVSWESHADQLTEIRAHVNEMLNEARRLEAMHDTLPVWQQDAIGRLEAAAPEIVAKTQAALVYMNANHNRLFAASYVRDAKDIASEAGELFTAVRKFNAFGKASSEEARLGETLGISKTE